MANQSLQARTSYSKLTPPVSETRASWTDWFGSGLLMIWGPPPALKLRVYISGGGCSGFQYGFTFDEERAEDDLALQRDGVTLLVDPLSLQYLMGAEVDYRESLQGAQFVIRNPNAKSTCGCGSSFSV